MVFSGLPRRNEDNHIAEIANMALDLLVSVEYFRVKFAHLARFNGHVKYFYVRGKVELGIKARIVLVLTRASLRLSCRTVEHGARVIKQNR